MKLVFLDIDGVLNTHHKGYIVNGVPVYDKPHLDQDKIARLQRILDRTGAELAFVTNWVIIPGAGPGKIIECLEAAGMRRPVPCRGAPFSLFRGDGVRLLVNSCHGLDSYLVLDDRDDYYPEQPHIQTDPYIGLTEEFTARAIEMLGEVQ